MLFSTLWWEWYKVHANESSRNSQRFALCFVGMVANLRDTWWELCERTDRHSCQPAKCARCFVEVMQPCLLIVIHLIMKCSTVFQQHSVIYLYANRWTIIISSDYKSPWSTCATHLNSACLEKKSVYTLLCCIRFINIPRMQHSAGQLPFLVANFSAWAKLSL